MSEMTPGSAGTDLQLHYLICHEPEKTTPLMISLDDRPPGILHIVHDTTRSLAQVCPSANRSCLSQSLRTLQPERFQGPLSSAGLPLNVLNWSCLLPMLWIIWSSLNDRARSFRCESWLSMSAGARGSAERASSIPPNNAGSMFYVWIAPYHGVLSIRQPKRLLANILYSLFSISTHK